MSTTNLWLSLERKKVPFLNKTSKTCFIEKGHLSYLLEVYSTLILLNG